MPNTKLNKGRYGLKVVSLVVAATFTLQSAGFSMVDLKARSDLDPSRLMVPAALGLVKEFNSASSPEVIINIKDVHDNYSAQNSIVETLENLVTNYDIHTLGIEGSEGVIDTSMISAMPHKEYRKESADYLMRQGKLSAAEMFAALNHGRISVYGMEKSRLYQENIRAYKKILKLKEKHLGKVKALKQYLSQFIPFVYSDELQTLNGYSILKRNPKIKFTQRWEVLAQMAKKNQIALHNTNYVTRLLKAIALEKTIQFKRMNLERNRLIKSLEAQLHDEALEGLVLKSIEFEMGSISLGSYSSYLIELYEKNSKNLDIQPIHVSELKKYAEYMMLYESIDLQDLKSELLEVEASIRAKLMRSQAEKELHQFLKQIQVMEDIFSVKLTATNLAYFREHQDDFNANAFDQFVQEMQTKHGIKPSSVLSSESIFRALPEAMRFYELADARNEALLQNTIRTMQERGESIGCLVTGGFHSRGITDLLKEGKTSYVVVLPRFNKDAKRPYATILTNTADSYEEFLESDRIMEAQTELVAHYFSRIAFDIIERLNDEDETSQNRRINHAVDVAKEEYLQSYLAIQKDLDIGRKDNVLPRPSRNQVMGGSENSSDDSVSHGDAQYLAARSNFQNPNELQGILESMQKVAYSGESVWIYFKLPGGYVYSAEVKNGEVELELSRGENALAAYQHALGSGIATAIDISHSELNALNLDSLFTDFLEQNQDASTETRVNMNTFLNRRGIHSEEEQAVIQKAWVSLMKQYHEPVTSQLDIDRRAALIMDLQGTGFAPNISCSECISMASDSVIENLNGLPVTPNMSHVSQETQRNVDAFQNLLNGDVLSAAQASSQADLTLKVKDALLDHELTTEQNTDVVKLQTDEQIGQHNNFRLYVIDRLIEEARNSNNKQRERIYSEIRRQLQAMGNELLALKNKTLIASEVITGAEVKQVIRQTWQNPEAQAIADAIEEARKLHAANESDQAINQFERAIILAEASPSMDVYIDTMGKVFHAAVLMGLGKELILHFKELEMHDLLLQFTIQLEVYKDLSYFEQYMSKQVLGDLKKTEFRSKLKPLQTFIESLENEYIEELKAAQKDDGSWGDEFDKKRQVRKALAERRLFETVQLDKENQRSTDSSIVISREKHLVNMQSKAEIAERAYLAGIAAADATIESTHDERGVRVVYNSHENPYRELENYRIASRDAVTDISKNDTNAHIEVYEAVIAAIESVYEAAETELQTNSEIDYEATLYSNPYVEWTMNKARVLEAGKEKGVETDFVKEASETLKEEGFESEMQHDLSVSTDHTLALSDRMYQIDESGILGVRDHFNLMTGRGENLVNLVNAKLNADTAVLDWNNQIKARKNEIILAAGDIPAIDEEGVRNQENAYAAQFASDNAGEQSLVELNRQLDIAERVQSDRTNEYNEAIDEYHSLQNRSTGFDTEATGENLLVTTLNENAGTLAAIIRSSVVNGEENLVGLKGRLKEHFASESNENQLYYYLSILDRLDDFIEWTLSGEEQSIDDFMQGLINDIEVGFSIYQSNLHEEHEDGNRYFPMEGQLTFLLNVIHYSKAAMMDEKIGEARALLLRAGGGKELGFSGGMIGAILANGRGIGASEVDGVPNFTIKHGKIQMTEDGQSRFVSTIPKTFMVAGSDMRELVIQALQSKAVANAMQHLNIPIYMLDGKVLYRIESHEEAQNIDHEDKSQRPRIVIDFETIDKVDEASMKETLEGLNGIMYTVGRDLQGQMASAETPSKTNVKGKTLAAAFLKNIKAAGIDELHDLINSNPLILGAGEDEFDDLMKTDIKSYVALQRRQWLMSNIYKIAASRVLKHSTDSTGKIILNHDIPEEIEGSTYEITADRKTLAKAHDSQKKHELMSDFLTALPENLREDFKKEFPGDDPKGESMKSFLSVIESAVSMALTPDNKIQLNRDGSITVRSEGSAAPQENTVLGHRLDAVFANMKAAFKVVMDDYAITDFNDILKNEFMIEAIKNEGNAMVHDTSFSVTPAKLLKFLGVESGRVMGGSATLQDIVGVMAEGGFKRVAMVTKQEELREDMEIVLAFNKESHDLAKYRIAYREVYMHQSNSDLGVDGIVFNGKSESRLREDHGRTLGEIKDHYEREVNEVLPLAISNVVKYLNGSDAGHVVQNRDVQRFIDHFNNLDIEQLKQFTGESLIEYFRNEFNVLIPTSLQEEIQNQLRIGLVSVALIRSTSGDKQDASVAYMEGGVLKDDVMTFDEANAFAKAQFQRRYIQKGESRKEDGLGYDLTAARVVIWGMGVNEGWNMFTDSTRLGRAAVVKTEMDNLDKTIQSSLRNNTLTRAPGPGYLVIDAKNDTRLKKEQSKLLLDETDASRVKSLIITLQKGLLKESDASHTLTVMQDKARLSGLSRKEHDSRTRHNQGVMGASEVQHQIQKFSSQSTSEFKDFYLHLPDLPPDDTRVIPLAFHEEDDEKVRNGFMAVARHALDEMTEEDAERSFALVNVISYVENADISSLRDITVAQFYRTFLGIEMTSLNRRDPNNRDHIQSQLMVSMLATFQLGSQGHVDEAGVLAYEGRIAQNISMRMAHYDQGMQERVLRPVIENALVSAEQGEVNLSEGEIELLQYFDAELSRGYYIHLTRFKALQLTFIFNKFGLIRLDNLSYRNIQAMESDLAPHIQVALAHNSWVSPRDMRMILAQRAANYISEDDLDLQEGLAAERLNLLNDSQLHANWSPEQRRSYEANSDALRLKMEDLEKEKSFEEQQNAIDYELNDRNKYSSLELKMARDQRDIRFLQEAILADIAVMDEAMVGQIEQRLLGESAEVIHDAVRRGRIALWTAAGVLTEKTSHMQFTINIETVNELSMVDENENRRLISLSDYLNAYDKDNLDTLLGSLNLNEGRLRDELSAKAAKDDIFENNGILALLMRIGDLSEVLEFLVEAELVLPGTTIKDEPSDSKKKLTDIKKLENFLTDNSNLVLDEQGQPKDLRTALISENLLLNKLKRRDVLELLIQRGHVKGYAGGVFKSIQNLATKLEKKLNQGEDDERSNSQLIEDMALGSMHHIKRALAQGILNNEIHMGDVEFSKSFANKYKTARYLDTVVMSHGVVSADVLFGEADGKQIIEDLNPGVNPLHVHSYVEDLMGLRRGSLLHSSDFFTQVSGKNLVDPLFLQRTSIARIASLTRARSDIRVIASGRGAYIPDALSYETFKTVLNSNGLIRDRDLLILLISLDLVSDAHNTPFEALHTSAKRAALKRFNELEKEPEADGYLREDSSIRSTKGNGDEDKQLKAFASVDDQHEDRETPSAAWALKRQAEFNFLLDRTITGQGLLGGFHQRIGQDVAISQMISLSLDESENSSNRTALDNRRVQKESTDNLLDYVTSKSYIGDGDASLKAAIESLKDTATGHMNAEDDRTLLSEELAKVVIPFYESRMGAITDESWDGFQSEMLNQMANSLFMVFRMYQSDIEAEDWQHFSNAITSYQILTHQTSALELGHDDDGNIQLVRDPHMSSSAAWKKILDLDQKYAQSGEKSGAITKEITSEETQSLEKGRIFYSEDTQMFWHVIEDGQGIKRAVSTGVPNLSNMNARQFDALSEAQQFIERDLADFGDETVHEVSLVPAAKGLDYERYSEREVYRFIGSEEGASRAFHNLAIQEGVAARSLRGLEGLNIQGLPFGDSIHYTSIEEWEVIVAGLERRSKKNLDEDTRYRLINAAKELRKLIHLRRAAEADQVNVRKRFNDDLLELPKEDKWEEREYAVWVTDDSKLNIDSLFMVTTRQMISQYMEENMARTRALTGQTEALDDVEAGLDKLWDMNISGLSLPDTYNLTDITSDQWRRVHSRVQSFMLSDTTLELGIALQNFEKALHHLIDIMSSEKLPVYHLGEVDVFKDTTANRSDFAMMKKVRAVYQNSEGLKEALNILESVDGILPEEFNVEEFLSEFTLNSEDMNVDILLNQMQLSEESQLLINEAMRSELAIALDSRKGVRYEFVITISDSYIDRIVAMRVANGLAHRNRWIRASLTGVLHETGHAPIAGLRIHDASYRPTSTGDWMVLAGTLTVLPLKYSQSVPQKYKERRRIIKKIKNDISRTDDAYYKTMANFFGHFLAYNGIVDTNQARKWMGALDGGTFEESRSAQAEIANAIETMFNDDTDNRVRRQIMAVAETPQLNEKDFVARITNEIYEPVANLNLMGNGKEETITNFASNYYLRNLAGDPTSYLYSDAYLAQKARREVEGMPEYNVLNQGEIDDVVNEIIAIHRDTHGKDSKGKSSLVAAGYTLQRSFAEADSYLLQASHILGSDSGNDDPDKLIEATRLYSRAMGIMDGEKNAQRSIFETARDVRRALKTRGVMRSSLGAFNFKASAIPLMAGLHIELGHLTTEMIDGVLSKKVAKRRSGNLIDFVQHIQLGEWDEAIGKSRQMVVDGRRSTNKLIRKESAIDNVIHKKKNIKGLIAIINPPRPTGAMNPSNYIDMERQAGVIEYAKRSAYEISNQKLRNEFLSVILHFEARNIANAINSNSENDIEVIQGGLRRLDDIASEYMEIFDDTKKFIEWLKQTQELEDFSIQAFWNSFSRGLSIKPLHMKLNHLSKFVGMDFNDGLGALERYRSPQFYNLSQYSIQQRLLQAENSSELKSVMDNEISLALKLLSDATTEGLGRSEHSAATTLHFMRDLKQLHEENSAKSFVEDFAENLDKELMSQDRGGPQAFKRAEEISSLLWRDHTENELASEILFTILNVMVKKGRLDEVSDFMLQRTQSESGLISNMNDPITRLIKTAREEDIDNEAILEFMVDMSEGIESSREAIESRMTTVLEGVVEDGERDALAALHALEVSHLKARIYMAYEWDDAPADKRIDVETASLMLDAKRLLGGDLTVFAKHLTALSKDGVSDSVVEGIQEQVLISPAYLDSSLTIEGESMPFEPIQHVDFRQSIQLGQVVARPVNDALLSVPSTMIPQTNQQLYYVSLPRQENDWEEIPLGLFYFDLAHMEKDFDYVLFDDVNETFMKNNPIEELLNPKLPLDFLEDEGNRKDTIVNMMNEALGNALIQDIIQADAKGKPLSGTGVYSRAKTRIKAIRNKTVKKWNAIYGKENPEFIFNADDLELLFAADQFRVDDPEVEGVQVNLTGVNVSGPLTPTHGVMLTEKLTAKNPGQYKIDTVLMLRDANDDEGTLHPSDVTKTVFLGDMSRIDQKMLLRTSQIGRHQAEAFGASRSWDRAHRVKTEKAKEYGIASVEDAGVNHFMKRAKSRAGQSPTYEERKQSLHANNGNLFTEEPFLVPLWQGVEIENEPRYWKRNSKGVVIKAKEDDEKANFFNGPKMKDGGRVYAQENTYAFYSHEDEKKALRLNIGLYEVGQGTNVSNLLKDYEVMAFGDLVQWWGKFSKRLLFEVQSNDPILKVDRESINQFISVLEEFSTLEEGIDEEQFKYVLSEGGIQKNVEQAIWDWTHFSPEIVNDDAWIDGADDLRDELGAYIEAEDKDIANFSKRTIEIIEALIKTRGFYSNMENDADSEETIDEAEDGGRMSKVLPGDDMTGLSQARLVQAGGKRLELMEVLSRHVRGLKDWGSMNAEYFLRGEIRFQLEELQTASSGAVGVLVDVRRGGGGQRLGFEPDVIRNSLKITQEEMSAMRQTGMDIQMAVASDDATLVMGETPVIYVSSQENLMSTSMEGVALENTVAIFPGHMNREGSIMRALEFAKTNATIIDAEITDASQLASIFALKSLTERFQNEDVDRSTVIFGLDAMARNIQEQPWAARMSVVHITLKNILQFLSDQVRYLADTTTTA